MSETNDSQAVEPTTRHLAALVQGRYHLLRGAECGENPPLLVGFHGYGESGKTQLESLARIPGAERWLVVAVDALHPFYTRKGDVVRSWMTKEDRESAIDANVRYASDVLAALRREESAQGPLVIAGFSQGVAMAWRAALRCGRTVHGLIALAGDVPPEFHGAEVPHWPRVLLGRGTEDTWYGEEKMDRDLEVLAKRAVDVDSCIFEGGHEWHDAFLARRSLLGRHRLALADQARDSEHLLLAVEENVGLLSGLQADTAERLPRRARRSDADRPPRSMTM